MKKIWVSATLTAFAAIGFSAQAQAAKIDVCVFDLLGKSGESYQMAQEWALAAKGWGAEVNLIPRQDEAVADNDFKAGKCDGVFMTAMRARQYNKFAGSIDALGGAPSNAIAQRAISFALDKRNAAKMVTTLGGKKYEVAGISPLGSAFIFVRDKNINSIEKAAGKKFAVLGYDDAQKIMVQRVGAQAVISDVSNFVAKFNNGQVDMVGAPAYAYKPLEIYKGLGNHGAMFNFPVLQVSADFVIRPEQFPAGFGQKSRDWFVKNLPKAMSMINRLEGEIPAKYKMNLSAEDKTKYQKMLRDGRMDMTKRGIYDPAMMSVLKRARCSVEKTNFECSLGGE
ncbi:RND transporter [Acinetobacter sp. KAM398]|uniref:putative solute-binding protein n=1 Tax=Acinetobacter TaxID=469 RepID=UPI001F2FE023|nr:MULTISPECIES: putative solute-binding protein [Acinetobacter]MDM1755565.1 RND transporter [Acinetobacter towneri]GJC32695.1 RND transporter [Acinetobacter sp. KAM392]GJC35512.1 RND transporter [Acinetobacter sp. KAM393]GJC38338.1 RND transporter [Acinetobacter sp. KAM394]GJC41168.1 RND transporter [Acinetobacter sp. KAM395]